MTHGHRKTCDLIAGSRLSNKPFTKLLPITVLVAPRSTIPIQPWNQVQLRCIGQSWWWAPSAWLGQPVWLASGHSSVHSWQWYWSEREQFSRLVVRHEGYPWGYVEWWLQMKTEHYAERHPWWFRHEVASSETPKATHRRLHVLRLGTPARTLWGLVELVHGQLWTQTDWGTQPSNALPFHTTGIVTPISFAAVTFGRTGVLSETCLLGPW